MRSKNLQINLNYDYKKTTIPVITFIFRECKVAAKTILLVDDEIFHIKMMKSILDKREGCRVMEAQSAMDALDMLSKKKPDLVLMDYYMPEMNGDECCNIIKRDPSLEHIPVIMLTSAGDDEERASCLAAGCSDYMTKPVNMREFLGKINQYTGLPIREHSRLSLGTELNFCCGAKEHTGIIKNIGSGGLCIASSATLTTGETIGMSFSLEGAHVDYVNGKVVWIDVSSSKGYSEALSGYGVERAGHNYIIGVKFLDLTESLKNLIAEL